MNLFIKNLSLETTELQLRSCFSEFGYITSVKIVKDTETGISRGFGFVEMANAREAMEAVYNLDGSYLNGSIISVNKAKETGSAKPSSGNAVRPGTGFERKRRIINTPKENNSFNQFKTKSWSDDIEENFNKL